MIIPLKTPINSYESDEEGVETVELLRKSARERGSTPEHPSSAFGELKRTKDCVLSNLLSSSFNLFEICLSH